MAKKSLWAAEEFDLDTNGVELETTPEEGEVAALQTDVDAEVSDVAEDADNVDAGLDASAELEQVEELVQAADEGEGLDPVAAEAVRLCISAIARGVGANPKAVYQLYASENFQSASSRKGNTTHALEGVQEFLKDLWKKIKAALTKMWTKTKAFWAKHVSNIGRMKKALDSAKAKVKASSGKIDGKPYLDKAPSGLTSTFPGKGDLNVNSIKAYLSGLQALVGQVGVVSGSTIATSGNLAAWLGKIDAVATKGPFTLAGGDSLTFKFDKDAEEGAVTLDIEREPLSEKDEDRGMVVADKAALVSLLDDAIASIKVTLDAQKRADKAATDATKFLNEVEKEIAGAVATPEEQKETRKKMRMGYKISTFDAKISTIAAAENVKMCKGVLGYVGACLKQFK